MDTGLRDGSAHPLTTNRQRTSASPCQLGGLGLLSGHRCATQQALPTTGNAPALAELGKEAIENSRDDTNRRLIADRTAIAFRKKEEKNDGSRDDSEDEESPKDEDEKCGVGHLAKTGEKGKARKLDLYAG